jgi:methionyl-tRNA formyltransferase
MKKIIFLGSKPIGYKCLSILLKNRIEFNYEIIGVLTNNNLRFGTEFNVSKLASDNGIPIIESLDHLLELDDIDLLLSIQYHQILKQKHIEKAKQIAINLHMAPLPEYRGCNQFTFALYNGSKIFGTTIHQLDVGVDSGKIIAERRFAIPENCLVSELYDLTFKESILLFEGNIGDIINGKYKLTDQMDLIEERGTHIYHRRDIERIKQIDLGILSAEVSKKVRATSMPGYEPPFTVIDGEKIYFIPARLYCKTFG